MSLQTPRLLHEYIHCTLTLSHINDETSVTTLNFNNEKRTLSMRVHDPTTKLPSYKLWMKTLQIAGLREGYWFWRGKKESSQLWALHFLVFNSLRFAFEYWQFERGQTQVFMYFFYKAKSSFTNRHKVN